MRLSPSLSILVGIAGVLLTSSGCSTYLDFSRFSGGDGGGTIDAPNDAGLLDAPSADVPLLDTLALDTPGEVTLTVDVTGMGTVTSDPAGIACGSACSAGFPAGTEVVLTAAPSAGSSFLGWDGPCAPSGPSCTVALDAASSVSAEFAVRGSVRWIHQVSFSGNESPDVDVVTDPDGNVILATVVNDGAGDDLYVAKLDRATGDILWMNHIETPTRERYGGVAVDGEGNVYVTAAISGSGSPTFELGGTTFTGDLLGDVAVFRLDGETGTVDWGVQWGGSSGQDLPTGIAVMGISVYVIGETTSNPASFGGGPFVATAGTGDGFLVRASLDNGVTQSLRHFDGRFALHGIAASGTGIAVTGTFLAAASVLGGCSFTPRGTAANFFVAAFAGGDTTCTWVRTVGDTGNGQVAGNAIAGQPDGGWVATGFFARQALFAPSGSPLVTAGDHDVFAVRYGVDGTHIWSYRYGGPGDDRATAVATMPTGETFLTGIFADGITFGARTLSGPSDVFVARFSAGIAPVPEWAVALGGDASNQTDGLAVDGDGNVYPAAYFSGAADIGGTPISSAGVDNWVTALVP